MATNEIQYITIASAGDATDFGDLSANRYQNAGLASQTRGVSGGGDNGGQLNIMEYITIASTGNAADFGDLTGVRSHMGDGGASNNTRGIWFGGFAGSGSGVNIIDYITIASAGNATDFGDLSSVRTEVGAVSNSSRAVAATGYPNGGDSVNIMEYVTIATTGDVTDFGDASAAKLQVCGLSSSHGGL